MRLSSSLCEAILEVEAALARASARAGLISGADADAVSAACQSTAFDLVTLAADAEAVGNPVEPMVRALRAKAPLVHKGATSQDIHDTATMLVVRRSLTGLLSDVDAAADRMADLAVEHRLTLMPARTLMQQALPTTFGLVVAGWLTGLDRAADGVRAFRPAVQLGGAAGTLASFGAPGLAVQAALAAELDLDVPVLPWHADRTRIAELAGSLGTLAQALGKVAGDVVLHSQTEVGELSDSVIRGGSSTLPHKRNPVTAVLALASTAQAPGLVSTLLSGRHEYQRAAGAWHAEWLPLEALLEAVGTAARWVRECVGTLVVHADRMRANLDLTGGAILAERGGGDPDDFAGYLGSAPNLVDRAVAAHRERLDAH